MKTRSAPRFCTLLAATTAAVPAAASLQAPTSPWEREIVYQIFPRSFADSNGDRIGDLRGITSKLDFLRKLGVTALLLNPVFASRTYHNYFADDFFTIDPEFGTNRDFFVLVRQAHRRRMKVILDMEVQYVADRHPWFQAVADDPRSPTAGYLWQEGSAFFGPSLPWYDGSKIVLASINPHHPHVRAYFERVFRYWADPNGDGNPSDGVDGFRIDHMMDDLDNKGVMKGMLQGFWRPLERGVKALNPRAFFVGEQSDWGLGTDLFQKADVDAVFAIPLRNAIATLDRDRIQQAIEATTAVTPAGKTQLVFIENHDVDRFASVVPQSPALPRLGAVLNLTLKGTPAIYYGQELGMSGKQGKWGSDGNDIPVRLAYEWSSTVQARGSAIWYRNTGLWWSDAYAKDHDGVSVEEQSSRPRSLLNFYRRLIALRASHPALREGSIQTLSVPNPAVLAYVRQQRGRRAVLVALNLSNVTQTVSVDLSSAGIRLDARRGRDLWTGREERFGGETGSLPVTLEAFGFRLIEVQ